MKRLKGKKRVWKLKQVIRTQPYPFNQNHLGIDPEGLMSFSLNKGNRRIKKGSLWKKIYKIECPELAFYYIFKNHVELSDI